MKRTYQIPLCAAFFTSGLCTTLLAALSPWIATRHHLSDRQMGTYFALQFFSSFLSSAIAARMPLGSLRIGFFCFAAGAALLCVPQPSVAYLSVAFTGLGVGFVNSAGNLVRAYLPHATEGLISINFMWSLGTFTSTLLMRDLTRKIEVTLLAISLLAAAQALYWLCQHTGWHAERSASRAAWRYEIFFAAALFLYVGAENGISSWTRLLFRSSSASFAGNALIAFMTAMLVGRLFSPYIIKFSRLSSSATLTIALIGGAACACFVPLTSSPLARVSLITLGGLLISPSFPLIVLVFSQRMPQQRAWAFCTAGLGASAVPFLMGRISAQAGLPFAFLLPAASLLVAFAFARFAFRGPEALP